MTIIKADPAYRRKFLLIYSAISILLAGFVMWFEPALKEYVGKRTASELIPQFTAALYLIGFMVGIALLVVAYFIYRSGREIQSAGRHPPPGTKLLRDTELVDGEAAQRMGASLVKGAVFVACVGLAATACWMYLAFQIQKSLLGREKFRDLGQQIHPAGSSSTIAKSGAGQ